MSELLDRLGEDDDGKARLFLNFGRAEDSEAEGEVLACAVRFYDNGGQLIREWPVEVQGGGFGEKALVLHSELSLDSEVPPAG